jgi:hypothetical protein
MNMSFAFVSAVVDGLVRRRTVLMLAFVPIFASFAFAQSTAPKKAARSDNGKCIGVVSAIGDTLSVSKTGFTVFNNENSKPSIESWRVDDLVFSKISDVLGKQFNLKRVSVSNHAFAVLEENHGPLYDPAEDIRSIVARVTMGTKCEKYIVVVKTHIVFESGGQRLDGLGLHAQGGQLGAYLEFTMNVYDGQSFSPLAKHQAVTGQKNFLGRDVKPFRKVDETWWPTSNSTLSAAAKDGFRSLVGESLDATVPKILND